MSARLQSWTTTANILLVDDDPFLAYSRKFVLERRMFKVERAADAAEAFIRLKEPGFAGRVALVIVELRLPGVAGPAFVSELTSRFPEMPVLVLGHTGEVAPDYVGEHVRFLPRHATAEEVVAGACDMVSSSHSQVA